MIDPIRHPQYDVGNRSFPCRPASGPKESRGGLDPRGHLEGAAHRRGHPPADVRDSRRSASRIRQDETRRGASRFRGRDDSSPGHPSYHAAKLGDADAAAKLVSETINNDQVEALRKRAEGRDPILVSVHAYEKGGVNAIPEACADELANRLGLRTDTNIVQTNAVEHTGADGYGRLSRQPVFDGEVVVGEEYLLVDDFVGWAELFPTFGDTSKAAAGKLSEPSP